MTVSNNIGDGLVIYIPEAFSVDEASDFRKNMSENMTKGNKHFILDFKDCKFIDSTGLGVIVAVYKRCMEAGGSIKLRSMNQNVSKVFKLTRLDKVFEIYT